ncbi:MAG TPA: hypothetical protein VNB24_09530 [Acidimicrobiales bacterium]|nr:hypothetical protein [Acidimicrobiales bacterium]
MSDDDEKPNHDEPVSQDVDGVAVASEPDATPGGRGWRFAVAVLAALTIGLAFVAAIQTSRVSRDQDRDADVRRTAAAMGTALLTYDYTRLDEAKNNVLELATRTFRNQYNEAFDGGLDELLKSTKATSEVEETEVFISEIGDDQASALVRVDVTVSGTAGTNRSLVSYVRLDLVRASGRWLVNAVTNLNLGQPAASGPAPGEPGQPTSTTTP